MKRQTNRKMNTFFATVLAASIAVPALAESKNKLDARVRDLTDYFEKVQKDKDTAVPAEILSKAEGMIIMRTYKAGFIVGVAGGHGVALVKNKTTGKWGPVGFVKSGEGSFGFQAGGQRSDMVLLLMNSEGVKVLTTPNFKIGADVSATVGPKKRGWPGQLRDRQDPGSGLQRYERRLRRCVAGDRRHLPRFGRQRGLLRQETHHDRNPRGWEGRAHGGGQAARRQDRRVRQTGQEVDPASTAHKSPF